MTAVSRYVSYREKLYCCSTKIHTILQVQHKTNHSTRNSLFIISVFFVIFAVQFTQPVIDHNKQLISILEIMIHVHVCLISHHWANMS